MRCGPRSVHNFNRQHGAPEGHARDSNAVVTTRDDRAGHRGSMSKIICRIAVIIHEIISRQDASREVGVTRIDAGVENRDDDVGGTHSNVPGLERLDFR